jgi:MinD superfamily P-loop ATPase
LTPSERKYHIVSANLLVFVDASKNLVMVDDVVTPSNPLVSLVEKEEFEEASFDVNVSQWLHKKNRPKEWCAFESIVWHGIVNCFLTHMP